MGRIHLGLLAAGVITIAIIVYAGTGIVYAGALIGSSGRTLNSVVSHQNSLNISLSQIDSQVTAVNGSANFDPVQEVALVDRSITSSQTAIESIDRDDAALASSGSDLNRSRWLTVLSHTGIDRQATRIGHARNALAAARTVAQDQVQDGHFWHYLYTALGDLDKLNTQAAAADWTSAKSTLATMKTDVDQAVQQSTAPGLPTDLHNLIVDIQTFVADYGKQLDAQIAGDDAAVAQYQTIIDADRQKLATYDIDKIGAAINAYYKPLIDRYNAEIAAATA